MVIFQLSHFHLINIDCFLVVTAWLQYLVPTLIYRHNNFQRWKGYLPLGERKPFPETPQRHSPQVSWARTSSHAHQSLARGLVMPTEIYSWTREEITILRAMWVTGRCLNKIGVLAARGRKRGCWVDICSSSRSSQLIPLFNMHTQTGLSLNSAAPSWPVQGLERDEDSVPACYQPSLHSLSVLILVLHSPFSLIFPPVGSTT